MVWCNRGFAATASSVWAEVGLLGRKPGMINMGQGFPDFPGSKVARDAAAAALTSGCVEMAQYSDQRGLLQLRSAISEARAAEDGHDGPPICPHTEVVVTTSGQEALVASLHACLQRDRRRDGVVVMQPYYPFLHGSVTMAGGHPQPVTLHPPHFNIDVEAVRAAMTERTGVIVVNSPHNPSGHVATVKEMTEVARLCQDYDLLAVSDEVYEASVFAPSAHHVRLADQPGMRDRTCTIGSAGKLFSLTGWRVAWATGPASLMEGLTLAHSNMTFSAPTPLQAGVAAALSCPSRHTEFGRMRALFRDNFARLKRALEGLDLSRVGATCMRVCPADGGYFLVADVGVSDMDFCRRLAEETCVVCTPMSVFYAEGTVDSPCTLVRFTICKSRAHIDRAVAALKS